MRQTAFMIAALTLCIVTVSAQTPAAQNPISAGQKFLHTRSRTTSFELPRRCRRRTTPSNRPTKCGALVS